MRTISLEINDGDTISITVNGKNVAAPSVPVAGITFDFQDGNGPVSAHRHINPDKSVGGWVANTARVYGNAQVGGNAQVYGNAWVSGNAQMYGDALVADTAQVYGDARVYGNAL